VLSQAEYWNAVGGRAWVAAQEQLDGELSPFGALGIDAAHVEGGDAVLDIGCGCGATSAQLADLVGDAGRVVGLDLSGPMLARARETVRRPNVEFVLGDASATLLPDGAFDVLFSRFGVMFFAEPPAAFAHLRAALKPSGRISLVVWRALGQNEWVTVPAAAVADVVELPPLGGPGQPGPFSLAEPDVLAGTLQEAGFTAVDLDAHDLQMAVGGGLSLEAAVPFTIDHGPLRRVLTDAPEDVRAAAAERIAAALAPFVTADGVCMGAAVWVVTARAS